MDLDPAILEAVADAERRMAENQPYEDAMDVADLVLLATRMATDTGERYSLDEVIEELGITEEEIAAAD